MWKGNQQGIWPFYSSVPLLWYPCHFLNLSCRLCRPTVNCFQVAQGDSCSKCRCSVKNKNTEKLFHQRKMWTPAFIQSQLVKKCNNAIICWLNNSINIYCTISWVSHTDVQIYLWPVVVVEAGWDLHLELMFLDCESSARVLMLIVSLCASVWACREHFVETRGSTLLG